MNHERLNHQAFDAVLTALAHALYPQAARYLAAHGVRAPECVLLPGLPAPGWPLRPLLAVERALIHAADAGRGEILGRTASTILGPALHQVFLESPHEGYRFAGTVATEDGAWTLARRHLAQPLPSRPPAHLRGRPCYAFIDGAQ